MEQRSRHTVFPLRSGDYFRTADVSFKVFISLAIILEKYIKPTSTSSEISDIVLARFQPWLSRPTYLGWNILDGELDSAIADRYKNQIFTTQLEIDWVVDSNGLPIIEAPWFSNGPLKLVGEI